MSGIINGNIVRNGLVLCLDAANPKSYSGSGTVWRDLSGNNHNFSLTCAGSSCTNPSFSNNSIKTSFNTTTNNYIDCTNTTTTLKNLLYGDHTIEVACKINSLSRGIDLNAAYTTETVTSMIVWPGYHSGLYMDTGNIYYSIWNATTNQQQIYTTITGQVSKNLIIHAIRISNTLYLYFNGNLITSASITAPTNYGYNNLRLGIANAPYTFATGTYLWPSNIDFYTIKLYNTGFNQSQVTQNFNSIRGRFGL